MSKVVVTLWEQAGKLSNQQKEGRYTGKDLFEAKSQVANYVSDKLQLIEVEGKGRGIVATRQCKRGELLMCGVAVATGKSTQELLQNLDCKI